MSTHENTLTWHPRKKRLVGVYRGVTLERGVAYQFNAGDVVLTVDWDGTVDTSGEPIFHTVDSFGGNARFGENARVSARHAEWFARLSALHAEWIEVLSQIGEVAA
jgi:hypothetical protein